MKCISKKNLPPKKFTVSNSSILLLLWREPFFSLHYPLFQYYGTPTKSLICIIAYWHEALRRKQGLTFTIKFNQMQIYDIPYQDSHEIHEPLKGYFFVMNLMMRLDNFVKNEKYPPCNEQFAPKNQWLKDDSFPFGARFIFSLGKNVSFRECAISGFVLSYCWWKKSCTTWDV